jgi:hypothetical protein
LILGEIIMRRMALILIVGAVAAAAGYLYYQSSYAPVALYKAFAEEIVHRRYDAASAMTDGITAAELARSGTEEKIGAGPAMFQTLFPSRFTIESKERSSDGTITLRATQTVLFNPPGVESVLRPAMYATMKQVIALRKVEHEWKVVSFENSFGSMDTLSSR